jgi:SAM-dependent methyltransferase
VYVCYTCRGDSNHRLAPSAYTPGVLVQSVAFQNRLNVEAQPRCTHTMNYVKSKQRVADHGEVFTPAWLVEAMLDLVKDETERIDSRFLEPACGSGNFLVRILQRKLAAVELKFGKSDFEKRHYALLAVMCTYGIELLEDNIAECRANLLEVLADYLKLEESDDLYRAAHYVLSQNLVHGDALKMRTSDDQPITFSEWGYLGKGKFQRRDFRLDDLTLSSTFSAQGSLFAHLAKHEIFTPARTYPPMTVTDLVTAASIGDDSKEAV